MAKDEAPRPRGRPATGRKLILQGGFEPDIGAKIVAEAKSTGTPLTVLVAELATAEFNRREKKRKG